jgi:L-ascorbate metabolism protein UlaG (beta-lactamase superfamily)
MTTKTLNATFVGGPTLHFSYAGITFLTDPTFDPPGEYGSGSEVLVKLAGPAVAVQDLAPVEVVLLSHDEHPDNLDVSGRALLAGVPTTLSTPGAAERIEGVIGLEPWQRYELARSEDSPVVVTAVPALHGPPGCEPFSGVVTGFVLEAEDWPTVYVSGDNASVDLLADVTRRFPSIAVAVLFVGAANVGEEYGNLTLGAIDAEAIAPLLANTTVVPVHAEDWAHFSDPRSAFDAAYAAAAPTARLVSPPRGVPFEIG